MRYLSLFSGIGGFELGIQQAYEDLQNRKCKQISKEPSRDGLSSKRDISNNKRRNSRILSGVCIGYSEIDKYAIQVYNKHFNHKNYGDITKINEKELPDFDLVVGGFPCQSFSIAGLRGGFEDTRGTLFFEIARIIREKQPRILLLENVKGLLSHDKGNTFTTIISTLDELGYDCQWQVLNSKNFGVPQNRERVFIVGHLRGTSRPEVFPIIGTNEKAIKQINKPVHSNDRIYSDDGLSPTINTMQGGNRQPFIQNPKMNDYKKKCISGAITATVYKEPPVVNSIRRITPKECERLQGLPDDWTEYGIELAPDFKLTEYGKLHRKIKISDSQRYKMCGNAVTVNVIKEIMLKLI